MPSRADAIEHLKRTLSYWPVALDNGFGEKELGSWRFIRGPDGIIYFADCAAPGITKEEMVGIHNWPHACGQVKH